MDDRHHPECETFCPSCECCEHSLICRANAPCRDCGCWDLDQ